jgi:hypothetical protein
MLLDLELRMNTDKQNLYEEIKKIDSQNKSNKWNHREESSKAAIEERKVHLMGMKSYYEMREQ